MIDENIYQAVHYLKLLKSPVAGSVHEKYRFSGAIYRTVQRINPIPSNLHEIFAAWVMATSQNSRYASSISKRHKKENTWNLKAVALTLKSSLSSLRSLHDEELEKLMKRHAKLVNFYCFYFYFFCFIQFFSMQSTALRGIQYCSIGLFIQLYKFIKFLVSQEFFDSRLNGIEEKSFSNVDSIFAGMFRKFSIIFASSFVQKHWILSLCQMFGPGA